MFSVIQDRKIRLGIVGCGRISKNHFGSVEKHQDNIELVTVCDINTAVLKEHQDKYQVPGYQDLEDMLNSEKLDLIAICTPSGLHPYQIELAAEHGRAAMSNESNLISSNAENIFMKWGTEQENWSFNYNRYIFSDLGQSSRAIINDNFLLHLKTYGDPRMHAFVP